MGRYNRSENTARAAPAVIVRESSPRTRTGVAPIRSRPELRVVAPPAAAAALIAPMADMEDGELPPFELALSYLGDPREDIGL